MRLSVWGFRAHTSLHYVWAAKPVRPSDYFKERGKKLFLKGTAIDYLHNGVACHLLGYVRRGIGPGDPRVRVRVRSVLTLARGGPWVPSPFLSPR